MTTKDVDIAEKIFGPDIGTLKGKTTRKTPPRVKEDNIEIPKELIQQHREITYCIDIMYVNGMPMLTGIDKTMRFRSLVPLANRTASELYGGIDKVLRHYNAAGYRIKYMNCDQEFKSLLDPIMDDMDIIVKKIAI